MLKLEYRSDNCKHELFLHGTIIEELQEITAAQGVSWRKKQEKNHLRRDYMQGWEIKR